MDTKAKAKTCKGGQGGSPCLTQLKIDFKNPSWAAVRIENFLHQSKMNGCEPNEVWPELYIGDIFTAKNVKKMRRYCFTHVLNCTSSERDSKIYEGMAITYMGIKMEDTSKFDISVHFDTTAEFIHSALTGGGKILVHCRMGVSRSATTVIAYLMLKHNMTVLEAVNTVKEKRNISPNSGFIRQLVDLHIKLYGC